MKVSQLIEMLQSQDPNALVVFYVGDGTWSPTSEVQPGFYFLDSHTDGYFTTQEEIDKVGALSDTKDSTRAVLIETRLHHPDKSSPGPEAEEQNDLFDGLLLASVRETT